MLIYLFSAYVVLWIVFFVYLFILHRRLNELKQRVEKECPKP